MAVIGGGSKYLTGFKETDKDEEDGKTISVHATDGGKTIGFGQDSEALTREENQSAERRLEASITRKRVGSDNDPATHSVDVLASFVQTFTKPEDIDELVELTQVHPLFQHLYIFPSYHEGWKILKRAKEASNPERLVSLGCKLLQCARHHTEVVHICAVNCDCKLGSRIVI
ncbi:unnamed protein product [Sphagnum jensenii]|uniref:Uncharacterized protein n=1 Tax=Sphagnum jensenii TaxID=128206 RepID=A0ABP1BSC3_9BRYO